MFTPGIIGVIPAINYPVCAMPSTYIAHVVDKAHRTVLRGWWFWPSSSRISHRRVLLWSRMSGRSCTRLGPTRSSNLALHKIITTTSRWWSRRNSIGQRVLRWRTRCRKFGARCGFSSTNGRKRERGKRGWHRTDWCRNGAKKAKFRNGLVNMDLRYDRRIREYIFHPDLL